MQQQQQQQLDLMQVSCFQKLQRLRPHRTCQLPLQAWAWQQQQQQEEEGEQQQQEEQEQQDCQVTLQCLRPLQRLYSHHLLNSNSSRRWQRLRLLWCSCHPGRKVQPPSHNHTH
jgi:hypothetical protein